ncbi:MAG: hypothetical protein ACKOC6_07425, partial [bacterium]
RGREREAERAVEADRVHGSGLHVDAAAERRRARVATGARGIARAGRDSGPAPLGGRIDVKA